MPLSPEASASAVALIEDGRSYRYVAERLGASIGSIHRAVKRFRETNSYSRRRGSGCKRATTARDDRFIRLEVLRDRNSTAVQIQNRLRHSRQVEVSKWTIRRRLHESNLRSRKPATGPLLELRHRRARLDFAYQHIDWTFEQWASVLFTDESRFALRSPDGRERVWRRPGERYSPCTFSPRVPFQGGSVMVWGGINAKGKTDIVFIEHGTLNAHRYIEEILNHHVVPFAPFVGDEFILMHDNARPHVAQSVNQYLQEVGIQKMNWPALSPDLNPIEHVWDSLGRSVRRRNPAPEDLRELREAIQQEWDNLDHQVIRNVIESMSDRMSDVIAARGGNTKY